MTYNLTEKQKALARFKLTRWLKDYGVVIPTPGLSS